MMGETVPSWVTRQYRNRGGGGGGGGVGSYDTASYAPSYAPIPATAVPGASPTSGSYNPPRPLPPDAWDTNRPPLPPPPIDIDKASPWLIDAPEAVRNAAQAGAMNDVTTATANAGRSGLFNAYKTFLGYDEQQAALQRALGRARGQSAEYQKLGNARAANLQGGYDLANRTADLKLAAMGIDRDALGADFANIAGHRNLAGREREEELANIGARRNLSAQELANQVTGIANKSKWDKWDINQASTGAGTWLSPGRGEKLGRVDKQQATDVTAANLGYQGQLQDLSAQEQRQQRGYEGSILDLDARQAQTENRDRKLGLIADEVGIDRDQARQALDFGLAQLGYDRYIDTNRVLDALDSTNAQEAEMARKMLTDFAELYKALQSGGIAGDQLKQFMNLG